MRKSALIIILILSWQISNAQDIYKTRSKKVIQSNLVKIGGGIQADLLFGYYEHTDYYYDYYDTKYPNGYDASTFISYEHLWQFPSRLAVAVEPKIGFSVREEANNLMLGNELKFYWANSSIWRMGVALSADYQYGQYNSGVVVSMGDGNYAKLVDVKMYTHFFNFDMTIIPFQFRFKHVPLVLELQYAMFGLGYFYEKSEPVDYPDGTSDRFSNLTIVPHLFKTVFKIGFVIPSKKKEKVINEIN